MNLNDFNAAESVHDISMGVATATDWGEGGPPFCSIVLIARGTIRFEIRLDLGQGLLLVALIVV